MARTYRTRLMNLFIAVDQFAHVVFTLGAASPDETISAAVYRLELKGRRLGVVLRPIIDFIVSPIEKDHCKLSYESELLRNQLPSAYRQ